MAKIQGPEVGYQKRRTGRWKKRHIAAGIAAVVMAAVFFGVPIVLHNRELVVSLINRNAGLAPMRVDLVAIEGGWFRPFSVRGLKLIDDRGGELIQVGEVTSELTLLSLLMNYRNLGTVTIKDAQVALDVQPGTTNLEEAFKPLFASGNDTSTTDGATATGGSFRGRVRIADARVFARDSVDLTAWEIHVAEADVPLPTVEQPFPPMTLVGQLVQTAALPGETPVGGQFTIRTQTVASNPAGATLSGLSAMRMSVVTSGMPLQWVSLVKRRMPDLPIDRLIGQATVQAEVEFPSSNSIMAMIQTAQVDQLQVVAPTLVGPRGAQLRQIKLSGDLHMTPTRVSTRGAKLDCDVGSVLAKADIALPLSVPSMSHPWLEDSEMDVQGTIDLPQLTRVAPDLIRTQDQVELVSGVATLNAVQRRAVKSDGGASAIPNSTLLQVELGRLQANVQGKSIRWDQALQAQVSVTGGNNQIPSFKAECVSEFCNISGSGDPRDGRLTAQLDLDKMEQRLSEWFVLPVVSLSGSAQASIAWKLEESDRLNANGSLRTTPIRIVHANGALEEPAWDGDFAAVARLDGVNLLQVDRAHATLKSAEESLAFQILEPLALTTSSPNMGPLPPAGMQIKLVGEMAKWMRRGQLFSGVDPGVQLAGKCTLEAQGGIDLRHVEITRADWSMEPFQFASGDTVIQDSKLLGRFAGRADTQDIVRTQVDSLLIQSESFAMQAQDAAVPGKSMAREGQGAFRLAPNRLMASMRWKTPDGKLQGSDTSVDGDVTGQVHWTIDPQRVAWQMVADGVQLRAIQRVAPRSPNQLVSTGAARAEESVLWEEPQAKVALDGEYEIATGKLTLPRIQVQTEWLAYGGQASITNSTASTSIVSQGSVTYDAASVAQRLKPFIGSIIAIEGQRSQALDVAWTSHPTDHWARGLQAKSSVGWDRANVVGIDIGTGEIPIEIRDGLFVSRASFPVSQGTLKWSLDGDLAAEPLIVRQAPERVIDNVAITRQMCQGWLKYVAPLLADATSVQGNLSLDIERAEILPLELEKQTVVGQVQVHGATVGPGPLADQLLALVQQIRALRKGAGATDGGGQPTSWLQLPEQRIGFAVEQGRVAHRNLQIQAGDVVLVTSGSVGLDGSLEMTTSVPILKEWVEKTPSLQSLAGQQIQVPVRGTIQRPQLDLSGLAGMTQQLATAALQGVAQKQIDKGLNKLLGPLEKQLGPFQQGMQQMQQGVQQSLPQLPLPNIQLPGFGAGPFGGATQPGATAPPPQTPSGQN